MFCYQCEQTAKGEGCTKIGVCGKQPEVAALQDLLIYALKGLSLYAVEGRKVGVTDQDTNVFTCEATFSTLTNVDFDPDRLVPLIRRCVELRDGLKEKVRAANGKVDFSDAAATFKPGATLEDMVKQGEGVGIKSDPEPDSDIHALKWTLTFGIKGVAAYADHARILGQEDDTVYAFIHEGLAATLSKEIAKKGKAILVSGHDLKDLEEVLKLSEGKGINVYTHGEMLPCHGYPELKKHSHFYGHYGTAWQNQKKEFAEFPGAILMTTNCIQKPKESYEDNIFTTGLVGWPGVKHIADKDFSPLIDKALSLPGFEEDTDKGSVMVGFARNAVMGVAGTIIEAVKSGDIKHFFLVAGCDGAKPGRNYYTELVEQIPKDCVVMTLACGKFRFFDKDLGDIGGIPRLLDVGQCNDAYSAIQIAVALAGAFDCGVNDLPLSIILSWYEQKAVAILLTLFHLGIKNIRLGPSLPAFITPNVLDVLVKNFNIMPISTPEDDLKAILG
ncbi:MAG: hydroxylamine reductase [Deltaproteobacteria bacterium]|nr:hydroxylamine reductase [Deltaproteobacteria bacterium]